MLIFKNMGKVAEKKVEDYIVIDREIDKIFVDVLNRKIEANNQNFI